jgi:gamma-glutamyltranspeptidase/glutathione hydrolase
VKVGAVASEPAADETANRVLAEGASAADAVVAGFLAAGARRASVLLCPVQALFAGPGAGPRAFDGRSRQPGKGLPRPRGVVKEQPVPDAALAAVPASLGALALLHAYGGHLTLERLASAAIEAAKAADARAVVIAKFAQRGPAALTEAAIVRPLLAVAGRTEGGLLSEEDLAEVRPESLPPRQADLGAGRRALLTPWPAPEEPRRTAEFVVAADATGVMAALSYAPDDDGLAVSELGLTLPRDAIAVRRGVPRVTPGEPLPCAAPIAMGLDEHFVFLALGVCSKTPLDAARMSPAWSDRGATAAMLLAAANEAAHGTHARAVLRSADTEQVQKISL